MILALKSKIPANKKTKDISGIARAGFDENSIMSVKYPNKTPNVPT
jgi:hypothetical protein